MKKIIGILRGVICMTVAGVSVGVVADDGGCANSRTSWMRSTACFAIMVADDGTMTKTELENARRDIEATADLLERAMKLSGLLTTLSRSADFRLSSSAAVRWRNWRMREEIVIGWEEWRASRAGKRANLERLGLDKPSRRTTDYGTSGNRLRQAFDGRRVPAFGTDGR